MSDHNTHIVEKSSTPECIDASLRVPLLFLLGNAVHWLLIATLISALLSIKLIAPDFLGGISFLTYGRLAPMARDLFLYGWATQAAMAAGIWLMSRLCGRSLNESPLGGALHSTLLIGAGVLWNLAVLLGTLAIFTGYSTGVEWLEYPSWASVTLLLSFLLIGTWVVLLFDRRIGGAAEVAHWYLVAAFCWFPWVYGTANLLLTWKPVQAPAQGVIQSWFCGSFLSLWLLPVILAALYTLIPRFSGQPLHRKNLATLGFWLLLLLGGWNGMERLIGGPIPAWLTSAGVVAGIFFLIPIIIIAINLLGTRYAHSAEEREKNFSLRFLVMGLYALIILGALSSLVSFPDISGSLRFTGVTESKSQLWMLGVISLPLFGVLYEVVPVLLGRECWCAGLTARHYWLTITGVSLLVGTMLLGGLFTGLALNDPTVSFLNITSYSYPFHVLECAAQLILVAAVLTLAFHVTRAFAGNYLFPKR